MKSLRHISLGIVIGFLLVLTMGIGAIDKTYYTNSPIFEDGYGFYYGSSSDSQMKWNASGYVDWNVTGYVDMDLTTKFQMDFTGEDATGGLKVTTTVPTGTQLYGGIYTHAVIAGTTDGTVAALRVKTSMTSASIPAAYVYGARITIEEVGATLASASICPLILETYLDAGGSDPADHYMMRFNTSAGAETPDAWFSAGSPQAVAFTTNNDHTSASTDKVGAIKIHIAGGYETSYIYVYSNAGQ